MSSKKILLVDDEADFLEMIKIRLQASDYDVVVARSGKEALLKIKSEKPDAILLDILMPGLDGLTTLKKIRRQNKDLPVFIITAFSTEERFKLASKLDASGFIVKDGDLKKEVKNITSAINLSGKYKK